MKMSKEDLARRIAKLESVVPKSTPMAVLQGVLAQDGYLIATNLELSVKAKIGGNEEPFIIPQKAFDLIKSLPDGDVEIIPDVHGEKRTITIKTERVKNVYLTMDPAEFPISSICPDGDGEVTLKGEDLQAAMKRVSYAIPANNANKAMASLFLRAAGGYLDLVGLDGHVLAWDRMEYSGDFSLLIPKTAVEKLLSIGLAGDVVIRHGKSGASFTADEYEVQTRLTEGPYFKFEKMFSEPTYSCEVERRDLLAAVNRAKICSNSRPVRMKFGKDSLNVSVADSETQYSEIIDLQKMEPMDMTIGFDAKLLVNTLRAFDCDSVSLRIISPKAPMFVDATDGLFRAMVLPVRIA